LGKSQEAGVVAHRHHQVLLELVERPDRRRRDERVIADGDQIRFRKDVVIVTIASVEPVVGARVDGPDRRSPT
jgi:hypothetical protein